ncbi:hypothetical protein OA410_03830, partial [Paracoccaceae bacterium]|nr:hypothetical protein [Paracoccaceae bacterium]
MVDAEAPELISFSLRDNTLEPGQTLFIDYDAMDASGIDFTSIQFRDENLGIHYAEDRNDDGVAELMITDQMLSGQYTVTLLSMGDSTQLVNNSVYYSHGELYGDVDVFTHSFDLSTLNFTVDNPNPVDAEAPELISISLRDNTLEPGQTLFIDYDAMDASGIDFTSIQFRDENLGIHYAEDRNDDGVAELMITDQMLSGQYTVTLLSMGDSTQLVNNSVYYSHGELYGDVDVFTHSFDLSTLNFTVNRYLTGTMTIEGEATEDQTLTVNNLELHLISNDLTEENVSDALSYKWMADNVVIASATNDSYTLTQDEVGKAITVQVFYTDDYDYEERVASVLTTLVTNVNDDPTGTVTINGVPAEDETLTLNTSSLADEDGLGDLSYQWMADNEVIEGATQDSFTLTQDEVGKAITVEVSYTDNYDNDELVVSATTTLVANVNDDSTGSITINGVAAEGEILTVNTDSLADEDGLGDLSYQWMADNELINGATDNSFTFTQDEVGKAITVQVIYTDKFYNEALFISTPINDT